MTATRTLRVDAALATLLDDPTTEFAAKYLNNKYSIHSEESIAKFKKSVRGLLTTKLDEKRVLHALNVHRFLMIENDMEDWVVFADFLSKKEISSKFWKRYRDHTAHQVLCFLLGAFIYENSKILRDSFRREFKSGPASGMDPLRTGFYYQWSTAALLHDFGYYLEVEQGVYDKAALEKIQTLKEFFAGLDKYLNEYIITVYGMRKGVDQTPEIKEGLKIVQSVLGHSNITHTYNSAKDFIELGKFIGSASLVKKHRDAWDLLDKYATKRNKRFAGVFQNYFRILATHGGPYSEKPIPMWDHGIASSVLFLKLSAFCWSYFDSIKFLARKNNGLNPQAAKVCADIKKWISTWDYTPDAFWGSFVQACFAMALHNLRDLTTSKHYEGAGYTNEDKRFLKKIGSNIFPVTLKDGVVPYLLLLVDQLQDWDRYPIVRTGDPKILKLLEAADIKIGKTANGISIKFSNEHHERRDEIKADLDGFLKNWVRFVTLS